MRSRVGRDEAPTAMYEMFYGLMVSLMRETRKPAPDFKVKCEKLKHKI